MARLQLPSKEYVEFWEDKNKVATMSTETFTKIFGIKPEEGVLKVNACVIVKPHYPKIPNDKNWQHLYLEIIDEKLCLEDLYLMGCLAAAGWWHIEGQSAIATADYEAVDSAFAIRDEWLAHYKESLQ